MIITRNTKSPAIIAMLCAFWSQAAFAGASTWEETMGARLRVVLQGTDSGAKEMRGVLQVELEPGWKTYWREPGASGIPPMVQPVSGASEAAIHFPIPQWVDQSYGSWAGYTEPVSLPITFTLEEGAESIAVDVFLGVCRDVCVPVTGRFEVPLTRTPGSALQSIQVDAAFSNLPRGNTEALSIGDPTWSEDGLLEVRVAHGKDGGDTQLFLAAGQNHAFKKPVAVSKEANQTVFHAAPLFDYSDTDAFDLIIATRHGIDSAEVTATVAAP